MSQLNLPQNQQLRSGEKVKKTDMLRSKQSGECAESVLRAMAYSVYVLLMLLVFVAVPVETYYRGTY